MRVLVIGGSGRTGKLIIEEALRRGKLDSSIPGKQAERSFMQDIKSRPLSGIPIQCKPTQGLQQSGASAIDGHLKGLSDKNRLSFE